MSSFSIYPIIRKDDWKKNSTRISKSRINDLEKLYMTIYKSFVQFILFLPLISPSLDWQLYYACTIEITRYYILSVSDKLWGGEGGKKQIRFLRKRRGMGMGTETIEVRQPNARSPESGSGQIHWDCAREWWPQNAHPPEGNRIFLRLSGDDSGTLAAHCPLRISFCRAVFVPRHKTKVHTHARASEQTRPQKTTIASRNPCRFLPRFCPLRLNIQPGPLVLAF